MCIHGVNMQHIAFTSGRASAFPWREWFRRLSDCWVLFEARKIHCIWYRSKPKPTPTKAKYIQDGTSVAIQLAIIYCGSPLRISSLLKKYKIQTSSLIQNISTRYQILLNLNNLHRCILQRHKKKHCSSPSVKSTLLFGILKKNTWQHHLFCATSSVLRI